MTSLAVSRKKVRAAVVFLFACAAVLLVVSVFSTTTAHAADSFNTTLSMPSNNLGLVGWWTFDGPTIGGTSVTDVSGQGNNGTMVNGATPVPGVEGQALSFNGTSQYVSLGNAATLQLTNGTLSAWIKTSTLCANSSGNYCDVISKNNAFGFFTYSNGHLVTYDWGTSTIRDTGVMVTDGKWHYVTMTFQSGVANGTRLYVDGALVLTTTITIGNQSNEVEIGNDAGSTQYFPGVIDDARIYNRALSPYEITQLYNAGTATHQNATINPPDLQQGLVGHWTFDGPTISGTTVKDVSGNGNNGTLVNGPTTIAGVLGQALSFNGTSQYATIGTASTFNYDRTQPLTICAWIKPNTLSVNGTIFSKLSNTSPYPGFEFNQFNPGSGSIGNGLQLYEINSFTGNTLDVYVPNILTAGVWQHACVTYSGNSLASGVTFYRNGVAYVPTALYNNLTSSILNSVTPEIGGRNGQNILMHGSIDDVRIYNRALPASQITQLYDLGLGSHQNATVNPPNLQSGLVGHWTFDGPSISGTTVKDVSGSGNNGTMVNGPTPVAGVLGQALSFNGTSQYVSVPDSSSLRLSTALAMALWFRTTSNGSDIGFIRKDTLSGARYLYGIQMNGVSNGACSTHYSGGIVAAQYYNGTCFEAPSTLDLNDGKWHQAVMTISGTTLTLYVDGKFQSSTTITGIQGAPTGATGIGADPANSSSGVMGYLSGSIDDVRIYNRALSASEVKQLYNLGR